MPEQPAARVTDKMTCPLQTPVPPGAPVPHCVPPGNPIIPPGGATVQVGNLPAARVGDLCMCVSPVGPVLANPVLRGAFPCLVVGQPAARMTDQGTHPGSTIAPPCEPTVLIGLAGTSGNPWAAQEQCQAMAAGRNPPAGSVDSAGNPIAPNTAGQSYNNCGIEASRQLVNRVNGNNPGQEALMNQALGNGWAIQPAVGSMQGTTAVTAANQRYFSGGTYPSDIQNILTTNGVPASQIPSTSMVGLETAVSQGRGVVTFVDAGTLWGPAGGVPPAGGNHWIVTTGIEYDDNGNPTHVYINDTGVGSCAQRVPIATFNAATGATGGSNSHIVTNAPIW